uniref:Uncharacterized protein n=1 Tax=Trichogramma kaykai TaxID=54128 RepID=A0ABD2VWH0_9HYME
MISGAPIAWFAIRFIYHTIHFAFYFPFRYFRRMFVKPLVGEPRQQFYTRPEDLQWLTPLHAICLRYPHDRDLLLTYFRISDEANETTMQINARDEEGDTPLHYALIYGWKYDIVEERMELLLRRGADPSLANDYGWTPLHMISRRIQFGDRLVRKFFAVCGELQRTLRIDARDEWGNTPLHLARGADMAEFLLNKGADPNSVNRDGSTPLHVLLSGVRSDDVEEFLRICESMRELRINARDRRGDAPLHLALKSRFCCTRLAIGLLLRCGADPNLAGAKGFTALHILCQKPRCEWIELLEEFFRVSINVGQRLRLDTRDEFGWTPLQWAVATFKPSVVDLLLDCGARLDGFVFPSATCLADSYSTDDHHGGRWSRKLELAAGALVIVERLEEAGYTIDRADALNVMKLFEAHGLYDDSHDRREFWQENYQYCVEEAASIMIKPSLSLCDLFELRAEEAARLLAYRDYLRIARSHIHLVIGMGHNSHLCEMVSRGFFRSWALDSFLELTRDRLPVLCCEMIIDEFKNEDLYRICLANEGQTVRDSV